MAIVRIQLRRDTAADWTSADPVLAEGEMGVETDTDLFKIGDNSTAWTSLGYGGLQGVAAATSPITYNSGTQTVGIDQTAISIDASQISDLTATAAELNILDGVTADATELNVLDGITATTAELNILDGVTATTAELNYVDGVTSAIQDQFDNPTTTIVDDATTARTITSSDAGKTIRFTSGSAITVTVDDVTGFSGGERVDIIQDGAGVITVTADTATVAGDAVSTTTGSFTIGTQYSAASILCVATDTYRLIGNITAVA